MIDQSKYDELIKQLSVNDLRAMRQEDNNFQLWLLDDYQELIALQNTLTGLAPSAKNPEVYEYMEDLRLMSDKGARMFTQGFLFPIIKNAKLTNLQPEDIKQIMRKTMSTFNRHVFLNLDVYAMKWENTGMIYSLIENFLFTVLHRSLYGAEQDRLGNTQKSIYEERTIHNPNPTGGQMGQVQPVMGEKKKNGWLPF